MEKAVKVKPIAVDLTPAVLKALKRMVISPHRNDVTEALVKGLMANPDNKRLLKAFERITFESGFNLQKFKDFLKQPDIPNANLREAA